jgi:hypothetical protein
VNAIAGVAIKAQVIVIAVILKRILSPALFERRTDSQNYILQNGINFFFC